MYGTVCRIIIGKSEGALVIKTASLSPHLSTFPYRHCMYETVCRIIIGKSEGALVIKTVSLSLPVSLNISLQALHVWNSFYVCAV